MTTHYDTLGVRPSADAAALRAAYLAKARVHHPDRHIDASPATRAAAARTMREVNAAWSVLSDPEARRRYDASLAPPTAGTTASPTPTGAARAPSAARPVRPSVAPEPVVVHHPMRWIPTVVILALLLGIFVFTAFAASGGDDAPRPTVAPGDLGVGACVLTGRVLTVTPCTGPHDATVVTIVATFRGCPVDTSVYTLDTSRVACLRPAP